MKPEDFEKINYQVSKGVALVTLNNPDRRNAWGGRMSVEYRWALYNAHLDDSVRVVVVTGGGADFCVGADATELNSIESAGGKYQKSKLDLPPYPENTPEQFQRNHAYPLCIAKPVIAAVNGSYRLLRLSRAWQYTADRRDYAGIALVYFPGKGEGRAYFSGTCHRHFRSS